MKWEVSFKKNNKTCTRRNRKSKVILKNEFTIIKIVGFLQRNLLVYMPLLLNYGRQPCTKISSENKTQESNFPIGFMSHKTLIYRKIKDPHLSWIQIEKILKYFLIL